MRPATMALVVLLAWPIDAAAQRYFGAEASAERGIEAFEVTLTSAGERVCRPVVALGCVELGASEGEALGVVVARRDEVVELSYAVEGTRRTMSLARALPFSVEIASALLRECQSGSALADAPRACESTADLRRTISTASRLLGALMGAFELTSRAIHISRDTAGDATASAVALATLDAVEHPGDAVSAALERLVRRGDLRARAEGADTEVAVSALPATVRAALAAARDAWLAEAQSDHECDRACGGCIPLSRRGLALEHRYLDDALDIYARALDDALWARGISVWTLDLAEASTLTNGAARGNVEVTCQASDWGRASFRRCAHAALRAQATSAAGGLAR